MNERCPRTVGEIKSATRKIAPANGAKKCHLRYVELARTAAMHGNTIDAENYYQHADHYFRVAHGRLDN